ncbi:hypothetical protein [Thalassotalea ganghwensis]
MVRNSFEAESLIKRGFVVGEHLILVKDYAQAWQMLAKGRADLTYANEYIAKSAEKYFVIESHLFAPQPFIVERYRLYVAASIETDIDQVERLRDAYQAIKADGTFDRIVSAEPQP